MTEDEKRAAGKLFCPGDPTLRERKIRSHALSREYNSLSEEDPRRGEILKELLGSLGENSMLTGPIYFHYGVRTRIGDRFFANFNLTVQDDAAVTIGDDCSFGPNVTIVTPQHPLLPVERRALPNEEGEEKHQCWAEPVTIGNDCWLGAGVVVCPGVTIGDGCVIGAGSVVTKDIPDHTVAVGVPCRPLRKLSEKDSVKLHPELFAGRDSE